MLITLLNELSTSKTDVVLVLDDYHASDTEEIHYWLAFLIDHLPPPVHLSLSTRAEPPLALARLRARGDLLEVRADNLFFTRGEAAQLLTDRLGLPLTGKMLDTLDARTDGWSRACCPCWRPTPPEWSHVRKFLDTFRTAACRAGWVRSAWQQPRSRCQFIHGRVPLWRSDYSRHVRRLYRR